MEKQSRENVVCSVTSLCREFLFLRCLPLVGGMTSLTTAVSNKCENCSNLEAKNSGFQLRAFPSNELICYLHLLNFKTKLAEMFLTH